MVKIYKIQIYNIQKIEYPIYLSTIHDTFHKSFLEKGSISRIVFLLTQLTLKYRVDFT